MLIATVLTGPKPGKVPAWMDWKIAGYAFAYDEKHSPVEVQDTISKYHLVRSTDCDGAIVTLTLEFSSEASVMPPLRKALGKLENGHHVRIGSSVSAVRAALGSPTTTQSKAENVTLTYEWHSGQKGSGYSYSEEYDFPRGKLERITYCRIDDDNE